MDNEKYLIHRIHYYCIICGHEFYIDYSLDATLASIYITDKFNHQQIKWLPIYGDNGYLDLMSKLIKGRNINDSINTKTVKEFEKQLNTYCLNDDIKKITFEYGKTCPLCNSKTVKVISDEILDDLKLEFISLKTLDYLPPSE